MPDVPDEVAHVVAYLFEVGPTCGEHAVTFSEIVAWCDRTGVVVGEFEAQALRSLSQHYLGMLHEASNPRCPAPVLNRNALPSKEEISNTLRDFLRSMNSPKAKAERAKRRAERQRQKETGKQDG